MNKLERHPQKPSRLVSISTNKIKSYLFLIPACLVLLLGIFFRAYQLKERMSYAHDGDLFSWIVKDIIINHHPRLIGQQTTAAGIFIGPAYYYALIPFFLLTQMDPIGAALLTTIIGTLSVLSYYIVFYKLFNKVIGLTTSFLQAVLIGPVYFDRRVVPSTPTNLWVVWYFFTIIQITRGDYTVLPILALLIAAIWNIHIALLPALLALPVAVVLSRKLPTPKQFLIFITLTLVFSLPLIVFEARHGFIQTKSLVEDFTVNHGGGTGLAKWDHVFQMVSSNANVLFFYPQTLPNVDLKLLFIVIFLLPFVLVRKNLLTTKELLSLYAWAGGVLIFFTFSSSTISEYYFNSIEIIEILAISGLAFLIYKSSLTGKVFILTLAFVILTKNLVFFINENIYHKGYVERKSAAAFIASDAKIKGFPCVAVSYITSPGENVGFRYFFWLDHLHVNLPKHGGPVYTIVIPEELAQGTGKVTFAHIGVIPPSGTPTNPQLAKSCSLPDDNLVEPMFGLTK